MFGRDRSFGVRVGACLLAGGCIATVGHAPSSSSTALCAAVVASFGALASPPRALSPSAAGPALLERLERWSPLCALAFFLPVLFAPLAPGADMAMHAALARAIAQGSEMLSPAWSDMQLDAYPRGFSAWLAVVAAVIGYARASIVVSGLAFSVYYFGLRAYLGRALELPYPSLVAAFLALGSRTPQSFYGWGGGPTAMALGFGLLAAGELAGALERAGSLRRLALALVAALLLAGGVCTHPIGAGVGAALSGIALWLRGRRALLSAAGVGVAVLLPLAPIMLWFKLQGPELSTRELLWIQDFQLQSDNALGSLPAWLCPLSIWWALLTKVGPIVLIAFALAAWAQWPTQQGRRRVLISLGAIELLSFVVAYGHRLPVVGFLIYPSRIMPLAIPALALPIAHALANASKQGVSRRLTGVMALATVSSLIYHVVIYQRAVPIATAEDLQVIACFEHRAPRDAIVDGAYGDATQWLPALTGHQVTHPHIHCSLFDEVEGKLEKQAPTYRFTGARLRYGDALATPPPKTKPVCEVGSSRIQPLAPSQ